MSSFETKDIPFMTLSDANKGINCAYEDGGSIDPLSMLQFEKKA